MTGTNNFLRLPDVKAEVGLSRQTIDRLEAAGEFPRRHRLSPRCVGWWRHEVEDWKRSRTPVSRPASEGPQG